MRGCGSPSERQLWACLVNKKLGVLFRRQYVLGEYIVDFAAPSVRLIVEVDGSAHLGREHADARREAQLRRGVACVARGDACGDARVARRASRDCWRTVGRWL